MTRHLLVIGAQRSGTTYLYRQLDSHPEIAMARPMRPEPKVFLSAEQAARGVDWYHRTYFAHATGEPVLGEKSTSYLEHPEAAERARRMLGDVHVLAVLRDPVRRAVSNWRFSTDNGLEHRPLGAALEASLTEEAGWDLRGSSVSPFAYLSRGRYADQLLPWVEVFPATRVLFFEELTADRSVVADLYGWLGVDPTFTPEDDGRPVNASREPAETLDAELAARLAAWFAPHDARLAGLLGRQLPWRPVPEGGEPDG